jgi:hypothetical protein
MIFGKRGATGWMFQVWRIYGQVNYRRFWRTSGFGLIGWWALVKAPLVQGRGPFPSWEAGAIDALHLDHVDQVANWCWPKALYECEAWNGFGHPMPSATLEARADIEEASVAFEQYKVQGGISLGDLKRKLETD